MDAGERAVLEDLMGRMAGGDALALFVFVDRYRGRLAATVRRLLAPFGRHDVLGDPAQVDELVQTAAITIFDHAPGWSTEGALPWTWAERAIRAELVAWIGHPHDELPPNELPDDLLGAPADDLPDDLPDDLADGHWHRDAQRPAAGAPARTIVVTVDGSPRGAADVLEPRPASAVDELAWLAAREPLVALLWSAIQQVASPRDTDVHIQYRVQKGLGDRSPALTVGAEFGLAPANVRQIDRRVRQKLEVLIAQDPQFGALRTLSWLAA